MTSAIHGDDDDGDDDDDDEHGYEEEDVDDDVVVVVVAAVVVNDCQNGDHRDRDCHYRYTLPSTRHFSGVPWSPQTPKPLTL